MDDKTLETMQEHLKSGTLTQMDVLSLLAWQLSLPAQDMDCDLISECDLYLSGDAPGLDPGRRDALLRALHAHMGDALHARTDSRPPRTGVRRDAGKPSTHRARPLRVMAALIITLLLALAVAGVAYTVQRGVLNFTEDFGFAKMVSQQGAEEFVSGLDTESLAHVALPHVIIDVLEAAYDGSELRVVYSLTDPSGELSLAEHVVNGYVMPGSEAGEVCMCDYLTVNGQDACFYDTWEMPGDNPGQMLYYLQTNLPAWGVEVGDAKTLTIGLPLYPLKEPGNRQMLEFTISADIPQSLLRSAHIPQTQINGHPVRLTHATFSPISGYVQLWLGGVSRDDYLSKFTGWCEIYAMDGSRLTDSRPEGISYDDGDGITLGFTITPPEGEWPDQMILALELNDYSPDWEVTLMLDDAQ